MRGESLQSDENADFREKFGNVPTQKEFEGLENLSPNDYLEEIKKPGFLFSVCSQLGHGRPRYEVFGELLEAVKYWDGESDKTITDTPIFDERYELKDLTAGAEELTLAEAKQIMAEAMEWASTQQGINFENETEDDIKRFNSEYGLEEESGQISESDVSLQTGEQVYTDAMTPASGTETIQVTSKKADKPSGVLAIVKAKLASWFQRAA